MKFFKNLFLIVLVFPVLLGLFSCDSSKNKAQQTGKELPTIAYYAYVSEPILDWDPSVMSSDGIIVLNNVYETLMRYDAVNDEITPLLAESYSVSDDFMIWTFKIRQGISFHDGSVLNAEAVKYSIDRTMRLQQGNSYIWNAVASISVVDEYTVEFELYYPSPLNLVASSGYAAFIFSPTSVTSDDSDWFAGGKECGTGPYMLQSQIAGNEVVLTQYENYWKGWEGEHFDKVVIKKITETSSRRQMLEKGDADITNGLPIEDIEVLRILEGIDIYEEKSYINAATYFNTQKEPLNNKLVRQALSYAFPYNDVIDHVLGGFGTQSVGPIPAGLWGHSEDLFQYSLNIEKAKNLLAEAGYPDGGFDLLYTYTSGDEDQKKAAELYKYELSKLGVNLEIRGMPWDSQIEMAKGAEDNRQDMTNMYWWPDYVSPISWMYNLYHTEESPLFNFSYYYNPEVDILIDDADMISAVDVHEATDLFVRAQEIIIDDAAAIFQYDSIRLWAADSTFKGYDPNPAYPYVVFFYDTYRE